MKVKDLRGRDRYLKLNLINWHGPSKSKLQKACKDILFSYWNGDKVGEEVYVPGTKMRFDFINVTKKIVVESNGAQHTTFNPFFHKKNIFNFVDSLKRDENKRRFCETNNIILIEVSSVEELHRAMLELNK